MVMRSGLRRQRQGEEGLVRGGRERREEWRLRSGLAEKGRRELTQGQGVRRGGGREGEEVKSGGQEVGGTERRGAFEEARNEPTQKRAGSQ